MPERTNDADQVHRNLTATSFLVNQLLSSRQGRRRTDNFPDVMNEPHDIPAQTVFNLVRI